MTYKEISQDFLDSNNISIGDYLRISNSNTSYEGMLLDRSEDSADGYLVLKLDSGYNLGVNIQDASVELISKGDKPKIELDELDLVRDSSKPTVSIISTGGTVSSIIDYKTGAVHPAFTADDLIRANPELLDFANIEAKAVLNILSENMHPKYWVKTARSVVDEINDGSDGVVIAHGTDTMHYSSAALSFMVRSPVPIVFTGAQRSSDRPSSDAYLNLINSIGAAKSDIAEVSVCMHSSLDDTVCYLHRGTKVRKMHTSRRDTFRSINTKPLAELENGNIRVLDNDYVKRDSVKLELFDELESKVALVKSFPGISEDLIDYHIDKGYRGIVIEGTGLGHTPDTMIPVLERAREEGMSIVMSSQCLYGRINMNVYSTGRKLVNAGVISSKDMLAETAYVKLSWALGQSDNPDKVREIMETNIAGEFKEESSIDCFLI